MSTGHLTAGRVTAGIVATVVAGAVLAPGAALAATPASPVAGHPRLTAAQTRAEAAIDKRLTVLTADAAAIARAKHLTAADRSTLGSVIAKDVVGLTALRATISADTVRSQLAADSASIYTGYRVFLLLQPQIRDVIAADAISAHAASITAAANALEAKLTAAGTLTADETGSINAAKTAAAAAVSGVNGEVAAIVALTPSMVTKTLRPAELATARADDKAAHAQILTAVAALATAKSEAATAAAGA